MNTLAARHDEFEFLPLTGSPSAEAENEYEFGYEGSPEAEWGAIGDWLGRFGNAAGQVANSVVNAIGGNAGIIDLTAKSDKSIRKGRRDLSKIKALVLHQMACCFQRKDPMTGYLGLKAHFAILPDGRILQIHPIEELIWASNGFNSGSVAVVGSRARMPASLGQPVEPQRRDVQRRCLAGDLLRQQLRDAAGLTPTAAAG